MNKKGFTLIETIMVVAILALLMLVLVPNVILLINKNNIKSCQNLENSIKESTKMYVADNKYKLGFECNTAKEISIEELINTSYLKLANDKIINPKDDKDISEKNVIVIYNCESNDFTYEFTLNCE